MFGRSRAVVGLDIGSSAVKAVELKGSGKSFKVTAFGIEPVPPDSIVDGAIIDGAAVADAIRRLFESKNIRTKDVAASLAGNAVIVKKITLPKMTEQELAESIYWEAEQYIPFDIQDVNLDYQVVGQGSGAAAGTMDVLLVAAKKEKIADYTGVITQAGRVAGHRRRRRLRAAERLRGQLRARRRRMVVALVNFGASAVNINILSGGQSLFTRDISIGGNAYTDALQRELNVPYETADALKRGLHVEGYSMELARPTIRAVTENVLLEIQKTFDFFRGTTGSDRIDRLVVSGGASRVDGFVDMLAERFDSHVELFDPFKKVSFDADKFGVTVGCRRAGDFRRGRGPGAPQGGRPMIRINLLSVEKPIAATASQRSEVLAQPLATRPARSPRSSCSPAAPATSPSTTCSLQQQDAALHQELIAARAEKARLQPILREVERFEAQKKDLQQRVNLIEELRQNQVGPVHMLDQISRSMPDRLWLTRHEADRQRRQLDGKTSTLSSLADFVANLEASGYFAKPVEITNSEEEKANDTDLIKFTVKATFEMPGAKKPARSDAGRRRGAAPGAVAVAARFREQRTRQCSSDSTSFPGTA